MLLMIEKGMRGERPHDIHRYAKANNKYMKHYDKNKELSYLKYRDVSNLYGWTISQKLPVNEFQWVKDISEFNEAFIKSHDYHFRKIHDDQSDKDYFLEVYFQQLQSLNNFHHYLTFFPERMKIEKVRKPVVNFHDEEEYVIHIKNLKQALNIDLKKLEKKPKKVELNCIIKFN